MADRQKVIRALHCCTHIDGIDCMYCPYNHNDENCTALMSMDVLELLKEQEAVTPVNVRFEYGFNGGKCPKCMNFIQRSYNYCPFCGQAVTWE